MLRRTLLPLFLFGALAAAGCGQGEAGGEQAAAEEEESAPIPVEVRPVSRGEIAAVYPGTAALEVDAEAEVVAKVEGEITGLLVEEGQVVEAGQVLARLDGDRLRLEVERQRANVRRLAQEYQRNVELHDKGLLSSGAFEGQRYELDALRVALELAELDLSYTVIRAPIDGVIAQRYVKRGNTVAVGTPMFRITDTDPLLAYLHAPEKEFNKLRAGQLALVQVDAHPDRRFQGRIARVSPVVDPDTGTFKVTVEVEDPARLLKPGMFGRISIVYDVRPDALLVPRVAVVETDTEASVFVVSDGVAQRRIVDTGYARGAEIEVRAGLEGDERIVVVGQNNLKDGGRVEVIGVPEPDSRTAVEQSSADVETGTG